MLNPEFAQKGWSPDPDTVYKCSSSGVSCRGFTLLMAIIMSGQTADGTLTRQQELEALLAAPDSSIACRQANDFGWTALTFAARNCREDSTVEAVRLLLNHPSGNDVALMLTCEESNTALTAAVYTCSLKAVQLLLNHPSGQRTARFLNVKRWSPLWYAASYRRNAECGEEALSIFELLLKHESSSELLTARDYQGYTVLMMACAFSGAASSVEVVSKLLAHHESGQFVLQQCNNGLTAVMHTILNLPTKATYDCLRLLLQHSSAPKCLKLKKQNGETALVLAARLELIEAVSLICEHSELSEIAEAMKQYPLAFQHYLLQLHQRTRERNTVAAALKAGIQLPGSIVLTYL